MKSMDMLEWMNDLDAKYLAEAAPPESRIRHRRTRRTAPALIAAAAAVLCLTVGAGAYVRRNTDLLDQWFGAGGEASVTEAALPKPVVYENKHVRLTAETELDDGVKHIVLLSCERLDGTPFDDFWHNGTHTAFVNEAGELRGTSGGGAFSFGYPDSEDPMHLPKYLAAYEYTADLEAGADHLEFQQFGFAAEQGKENLLEGIRIPLHAGKNTALADFETVGGIHLQLSCFELLYEGAEPDDPFVPAVLIFKDGSRKTLEPKCTDSHPIRDENGNETADCRISYTEFDYVDVSTVTAIEFGGVRYHRIG